MEEKTSDDKVFVFTVALQDGFNILRATAGCINDCATLEKVDTEPEIYRLPVEDDGSEGAANWFTQMGSLEMVPEMIFPEGKYNIDSSLGSIYNNPDAWNMLVELMKLPISPAHGMWGMVKNFTVRSMMEMGGEVPEAAFAMINAKLIEYDVVE